MAFRGTVRPKKNVGISGPPRRRGHHPARQTRFFLRKWSSDVGRRHSVVARRFNRGLLRQPVDRASRGVVEGYPAADTVVFVVDDDASLRQALVSLLQSVGLRVEAFGSAADFLKKGQLATLPQPASFLTSACRASADSIFKPN